MKPETTGSHPLPLKIVVIGGSGLIGAKVVELLRRKGHEVTAASPSKGVNSVTGEGLAEALTGAHVLVDVSNSPSFEDRAVLDFFQKSTANLLSAAAAAGIRHYAALSVVGTDRLQASGYFRAKLVQENMIRASTVPSTLIRATQFFEFAGSIAQSATREETVRLPSTLMQPVHSGDVAAAVADAALADPRNAMEEVAGPEPIPMAEMIRLLLLANDDPRQVVIDESAGYFGTPVDDQSLTPGKNARLGTLRFNDWLAQKPGAR